ncbi:MAG: hypothetical protein IKP60_13910 [Treponema sp.]|nr:hypothetical protein [Treponema sp.]
MFEKEAEENKPPYAYCALDVHCELWKDGFQKGAEFGYNKAKEEIKQNGLALQSDMDKTIEQNIALKKELEKANERHSPDEHIDKDSVVLGIIKHCRKLRYSLVQWNGEWWYQYGTYKAEVRLIAWYNIPELKEVNNEKDLWRM